MNATLEERLTALEDRAEIGRLRALYCHYIDQHRWDDVADLFTEDCEYHGRLELIRGRDGLVAYFQRSADAMEAAWHRSLNETLDLDGDRATGAAYFDVPCVVDGTPMLCAGRYEDEFVKREGRWRFRRRGLKFFYLTPLSEGWGAGALPDELAAR